MKNKSFWIVLMLILLIAGGGFARQAKAGQDPPIGPYTVINLPLEDLPRYDPGFFYNPVIDKFPGGASLQVLYVLEDPRDVPLARYGYWRDDLQSAVGPSGALPKYSYYLDALAELEKLNPKTINVYIRVSAPADSAAEDPFIDKQGYHPYQPAIYVSTEPLGLELGSRLSQVGISYMNCAMPEYADGTIPYKIPDALAGGDAINAQGLYDPKAYAPPLPWYPYEEAELKPGEVREGWISCLAPKVPLDEIHLGISYSYPAETDLTPAPTDLPAANGEAESKGEECVQVESFDDPACLEAACCTVVLVPESTVEAMNEPAEGENSGAASEGSQTVPAQIETGYAQLWNFNQVRNIPEKGLVVENTGLTFTDEAGKKITDTGTVVLNSAYVARIEMPPSILQTDQLTYDYRFISRLNVEPNTLSREEVSGYTLSDIDLSIAIYAVASDPDQATMLTGADSVNKEFYFRQEGGSLAGYAQLSLIPYFQYARDEELPASIWFEMTAGAEERHAEPRFRYPAQGINIRNLSLVSRTTMCDVLDCQIVQDHSRAVTQLRTVPIMCPGEWANNFTLSGMRSEVVNYFGVPKGLKNYPNGWVDSSVGNFSHEIWFVDGEILGGLAPWWIDGNETWKYGRATGLEGTIIDTADGSHVDIDVKFLPLFAHLGDQRTYYAEVDDRLIGHGWMPGRITGGLLIAGIPEENTSFQHKAFMFQAEGPLWTSSCSRPLIANLAEIELYAPAAGPLADTSIQQHNMTSAFPGMVYPLSMPLITGDQFGLGEAGEQAYGYTFKPTEVNVVPGRSDRPVVYVRQEDKFYPANERVSTNNEAYFSNVGAEIIPPGNSLVFVKIEKDPPGGPIECQYVNNEIFQLTYPGQYTITSQPGNFRRYGLLTISCPEDFSEAWLVFTVPSLEVDIEQVIFTIRGEKYWSMWKLN